MTIQKTATKAELEDAIADIWETAQNAEGSRAGMQDALDQIQDACAEVIPDVEERVTGEDEDPDDDADADDLDVV